jgi:predicted small metal-binding protein
MAKMMSCECGWTLITPMGEADLKKHAKMHVADAHPGMKMTDDMMSKMMKTV